MIHEYYYFILFKYFVVGLRTVAMGYQSILAGDADVVVAAGQESMSQVRRREREKVAPLKRGKLPHNDNLKGLSYQHTL